jgi:lipopolysaccharide/colanic/teichoic acid biosynthesis glycosyltransferase
MIGLRSRYSWSFEERVAADADYAKTWSLWTDIKIILIAPPRGFFGYGSY